LAGVVVITGGSRGIGAACAVLAARAGYKVAINYRADAGEAVRILAEVRKAGSNGSVIRADMGKPADVARLFQEADLLGPVTGLINNAGIVDARARIDEMDAGRIERMFAVNAIGPVLAAGEAVRRMSTRHGGKGGSIVNISSAAAVLGGGGQYVDYAATKGAIDTLTIGLAREVAEEGIRVNAVRPGIIDTDIHASGGEPDRARLMAAQVPMKRAGSAEEVARAVLWLMSDEASYITGAILPVSGGR
jgi:NAD(P)-dependent dehydrogenase (short-subunit alcohol dehydrogenase family)